MKQTYTWIYLQTGSKKKKLTFVLCIGNNICDRITDVNNAYQFEKSAIASGKYKFKNSIDDFLQEQKKVIEAHMNHEKYIPRTNIMKQAEFNAFLAGK